MGAFHSCSCVNTHTPSPGNAPYNAPDVTTDRPKLIVAAAMGNCVHVAGVANFLRLAEEAGFRTHLLPAAAGIDAIVDCVRDESPAVLAVSYRLTPAVAETLLEELLTRLDPPDDLTLLFGGTAETAAVAKATGRFAACFVGDEPHARIRALLDRLAGREPDPERPAESVAIVPIGQRLAPAKPAAPVRPLLRHHFGLPDLEATVAGVRTIAGSEALDVISIAPDQNAQQFFFRPERMDATLDGAGGVPLRKPEDLRRLYDAARAGNQPYLRIYSGTSDLVRWAEMSAAELHNAWGAIPLTWYSRLDGRSDRPIEDAIAENLQAIRWYAERGIPVEVTESHQWSLRDAPDAVAVAMAYVAAYAARRAGVRQLFAPYMFNTPAYVSAVADLAKMAAAVGMIHTLTGKHFSAFRQVRAGLTHFSADADVARGQLAASAQIMLALRPHILHVVGYCEAQHAASAGEVVESCRIVAGVLRNASAGLPDPLTDPRVAELAGPIRDDACLLLGTLERFGRRLGSNDPLCDPKVLASALATGLLDAPHLAGQPCALGRVRTGPVGGACRAIDEAGRPIAEPDRLLTVLRGAPAAELVGPDADTLIAPLELPDGPAFGGLLT